MKNSNLKSIFDQTGQKKIENNLGKGLFVPCTVGKIEFAK